MLQAHEAQPRMSRLEDHMSSPEGRSLRRRGSARRARLGSRDTRRSRWRRDAWRRCSTATLRRGPRRDRYCCRCRRLLRSRRLGARSRHPAGHNSRSRRGCRFPCRWSLCRYRPIRLIHRTRPPVFQSLDLDRPTFRNQGGSSLSVAVIKAETHLLPWTDVLSAKIIGFGVCSMVKYMFQRLQTSQELWHSRNISSGLTNLWTLSRSSGRPGSGAGSTGN